jgi:hypothetical protein
MNLMVWILLFLFKDVLLSNLCFGELSFKQEGLSFKFSFLIGSYEL